jgi:RNA polymerase sigma factor (sigma-70 family)
LKEQLDKERRDFQSIQEYRRFYRSIKDQLPQIDEDTINKIHDLGNKAIEARDRIVKKYQDYVKNLAKTIVLEKDWGFSDIFSSGMMILAKKVEEYDPNQEAKFMTYAYEAIVGGMKREKALFIPVRYPEEWYALKKRYQSFCKNNEAMPNEDERDQLFMKQNNITEKVMRNIKKMQIHVKKIDDINFKEMAGLTHYCGKGPEIEMIQIAKIKAFVRASRFLSEKKQEILRMLLDIDHESLSMKEVAKKFDVSVQRISQIRKEIIDEMSAHFEKDVEWNSLIKSLDIYEKAKKPST